jgi:hypothetical protein
MDHKGQWLCHEHVRFAIINDNTNIDSSAAMTDYNLIPEAQFLELCKEHLPLMKAEGYDDCVIGFCSRFGQPSIIAYSRPAVIAKLISHDGMSEEDAEEFFEYNIIGAYVGETTPCFIEMAP